jgi:PAS domain S-box-containing protein
MKPKRALSPPPSPLPSTDAAKPRQSFDWMDAKVRLLLQAAPDAMIVVDGTGEIVLANSQTQLLFGFAEQELIGERIEMLVPQRFRDGHSDHRGTYSKQPRVRQMGTGLELHGQRKDGSEFPVEISLSPLNIDGIRFVTAAIRDITGRRKTEDELRKLNAELHSKMAELAAVKLGINDESANADPRSPEQQLRQMQKMEAVGQLASGVAHDFNNILNVISGYAELLHARITNEPDRKMLLEIQTAVRRAATLTHQLLAFGRQQVMLPIVLDPNTVCREMETMLGRVIGEDVELLTEFDPNITRVKIDRGQLEQVLLNLAINARDAMPRGGRLNITTRMADLDQNYVRKYPGVVPGQYVEISVADTGKGMDEHTRLHLFEPFFTTKDFGKGTGLGLATVYGIVKQSGGHISVYSELDHGSAFKFYLPPTEEDLNTGIAADHLQGLSLAGSESILLVEDEKELRNVSRLFLETRGYSVVSASHGQEALDLLKSGTHLDLLITDVVMPGMSGRELAAAIAALRPTAKVLFMSGYTDDAMLRHGLEQGRFPFIRKPFSLNELSLKVREILAG